MITLAILLVGIVSARAEEQTTFRDSAYAVLKADSQKHGITHEVDTEAAVRALADRLNQLHQFRPPLGFLLENARPVVNVASASMIWLKHLTHLETEGDHSVEDRRIASSLAKLVSQAIDAERSIKDATTLRKYSEQTFRHGLRFAKMISAVDPEFAKLLALGKTDRLQRIFSHVADSLATECSPQTLEI